MNGCRIGSNGHADAFCRGRFLVAWWSFAPVVEVAAATLGWSSIITAARAAVTVPWSPVTIIATWWALIAAGMRPRFAFLLLLTGSPGPRGSKGEAGQEAAQWVVFRITHEVDGNDIFLNDKPRFSSNPWPFGSILRGLERDAAP